MKTPTQLTHLGRNPRRDQGLVNTAVYRGSTVLFPTLQALEAATAAPYSGVFYGRFGTPTRFDFEQAMAALDHKQSALALPSGLAACTASLMAHLQQGDQALIADTVYWPTRHFCDTVLARAGIQVRYYDPCIGECIAELIEPKTRVIFMESPGSLSFEVQDVPAICAAAKAAACVTVLDNTWATPLGFDAASHGVDLVVHAATKYIVGHSDAMLGVVSGDAEVLDPVRRTAQNLGHSASPDDCWLGLRGLRTLGVRLPEHARTAAILCDWLDGMSEVVALRYPPRIGDPGHSLFERDFIAGSGLFAFALEPTPRPALAAMLDGMRHFAMGYSWGGYESLILPIDPGSARSATPWPAGACWLRVHAGLEQVDDLIEDLDAGLRRRRAALGS